MWACAFYILFACWDVAWLALNWGELGWYLRCWASELRVKSIWPSDQRLQILQSLPPLLQICAEALFIWKAACSAGPWRFWVYFADICSWSKSEWQILGALLAVRVEHPLNSERPFQRRAFKANWQNSFDLSSKTYFANLRHAYHLVRVPTVGDRPGGTWQMSRKKPLSAGENRECCGFRGEVSGSLHGNREQC